MVVKMQTCADCEQLAELGQIVRGVVRDSGLAAGLNIPQPSPAEAVVANALRHAYHGGMGWMAWDDRHPRAKGGMTPHGFAVYLVEQLRSYGYEIVGGIERAKA